MPTPYFAISVGLAAIAIAWFKASYLWRGAEIVGTMLGLFATLFLVIFLALYTYKIVAFHHQVEDEWNCPVRFSFLALIFISIMLVGDLLYHWKWYLFGEILVWLAVFGQLTYSLLRIGSLLTGNIFKDEAVQPPFYLPAVASNFTTGSSLAVLGYIDLAYLFFGAGFFAWLAFEPILLQRLRVAPLPVATKGTIGIVLAPAFVGVASYLTINGGHVDLFAKFLWGYGFLQFIFLLRIFPSLIKNGFSVGFWSFSFGLASMANSAIAFYEQSQLTYLALFSFVFANLMILFLILGTVVKILKRQFWLK
ncbi:MULTISPECIES: dicarboxylate transporter/tellurite-resistance protein TehA [Mannheimia]|uniref:Dicarboxylate transporter/tellurite-resistance protein TehA n=1 Tax=Mannheimia pernigra TaxID=111844 RepID=A0A7H8UXL2_9PAST|nr:MULTISPECIES: dicarboxylate transporter/tellurite-resistance protein TehA [Mannheimia]QLB41302.1 dicarboxylate transporter/tellurite-resistance protein TehA [Mannheimia pernigra]QLB43229.1 dicarboxylate transporter/tellurite-resistance protein TehA [Mannheimia pernigra]QLB45323.1 dicarboxylate transporter/tellurite-resistance protein TehA [Mannheimia pernigra]QTM01981.1 dicarboxylate transporter/tellurite-resistance protein TehA [Mannheimia sp. ZY171111]